MSLPGFSPISISQLGFTPSQITTASMSFGVPLPESESEFPSYPHYPHSWSFVDEETATDRILRVFRKSIGFESLNAPENGAGAFNGR